MEAKILNVEDLKKLKDNDRVAGLALIMSYSTAQAKNGSSYINGFLQCKGEVQFKSWGNSNSFSKMSKSDYSGIICYVEGKANFYGGMFSVIIDDVYAVKKDEINVEKGDFFEEKYDRESLYTTIRKLLSKDSDCLEIYDKVMKKISDRFKCEFAASYHHDNCRGGLVAHSYKVARMYSLISMYPFIAKYIVENGNVLLLGLAIHDIGKVLEYSDGVTSDVGLLVDHNTLGVELLVGEKEYIINKKGEEFYYRLLSIVEQHHGEFGSRPRTVEAYITHMFDILEARLEGLDESLSTAKDSYVSYDGFKLS